MSDKTGWPAFPSPYILPKHQGMTLLDYFAGQALAMMKAPTHDTMGQVAFWAYETAEAMIKEKEERK